MELRNIAQLAPVQPRGNGNSSPSRGQTLPESPQSPSSQPVAQSGVQPAATPQPGPSSPPADTASQAEKVEKAVQRLNDQLRDMQRDLQFSVDSDSGRTILKVIHSESGEVIRQIPPEELLHLARAFAEGTGSLISDQA